MQFTSTHAMGGRSFACAVQQKMLVLGVSTSLVVRDQIESLRSDPAQSTVVLALKLLQNIPVRRTYAKLVYNR